MLREDACGGGYNMRNVAGISDLQLGAIIWDSEQGRWTSARLEGEHRQETANPPLVNFAHKRGNLLGMGISEATGGGKETLSERAAFMRESLQKSQ